MLAHATLAATLAAQFSSMNALSDLPLALGLPLLAAATTTAGARFMRTQIGRSPTLASSQRGGFRRLGGFKLRDAPEPLGANVVPFPSDRVRPPAPLSGRRRYFIHLDHAFFTVTDEIGEELDGDDAARTRVAALAETMIALDPENARWRYCAIVLTDEAGRQILRRPVAEMALARAVSGSAAA